MIRRLFALASALSLLLCAAAVALWVRSYRHANEEEDRFSWLHGGERYTVRCDAGRATLFQPPAGDSSARASRPIKLFGEGQDEVLSPSRTPSLQPPAATRSMSLPTATEAVAAIDNRQVDLFMSFSIAVFNRRRFFVSAAWIAEVKFPVGAILSTSDVVTDAAGKRTTIRRPPAFKPVDLFPSLLAALEDSNRFAAAHHILTRIDPTYRPAQGSRRFPESVEADDGLRLQLISGPKLLVHLFFKDMLFFSEWGFESRPDLTQLPAVRDQWHRRLDVLIIAVPFWEIAIGTGIAPSLWFAFFVRRRIRRRRRRRAGQCAACGYDLRASPELCPECGAGSASKGAA